MIKFSLEHKLSKSGCLVVPLWEGGFDVHIKKMLGNEFASSTGEVYGSSDFEGKTGQSVFLYTHKKDISRVLLIGLGQKDKFSIRTWKNALGTAVILLQQKKIIDPIFAISESVIKILNHAVASFHAVAGIEVANYAFDDYKEKAEQVFRLKTVKFFADFDSNESKQFLSGIKEGMIVSESVNYARNLGNIPPTIMTPSFLALKASELARKHQKIKAKILGEKEIEKLGMGCLLGVSRGSEEEPRFIIMEFFNAKKSKKPVVLVGKGITFDSGGLSLKPSQSMNQMKYDMLGGATIMAVMKASAELDLKINLVCLVPACENMPDGFSYRPDDILRAMNGKTVLVDNTDAEGRLILADALCYAKKYNPKQVIDLATLTGACVVALGNERSGLFSADDDIVKALLEASEKAGEYLWRLPLGEEYTEAIKSDVADIKNTGSVNAQPSCGGASTGAAFLQYFTDYPWAHIDLSCSYYAGAGKPHIRGGANGFGVQTLIEYLKSQK